MIFLKKDYANISPRNLPYNNIFFSGLIPLICTFSGKILGRCYLSHTLLKGNIAIAVSQNLRVVNGASGTSVQADVLLSCFEIRSPSGKNTKIREIQPDGENEWLYKDIP